MARLLRQTRWFASLLLVFLPWDGNAGAQVPASRQPIAQIWVSPKPISTVERCIVKALDDNRRTYSRISPSVRHVANVSDGNSVIDIRPAKDHVLADTDYHVRLEKIHDQITRVALYTTYSGAKADSGDADTEGKNKKKPAFSIGKDIANAVSSCMPSP
jgi:hypothetical protein